MAVVTSLIVSGSASGGFLIPYGSTDTISCLTMRGVLGSRLQNIFRDSATTRVFQK